MAYVTREVAIHMGTPIVNDVYRWRNVRFPIQEIEIRGRDSHFGPASYILDRSLVNPNPHIKLMPRHE